MTKIGVTWPCQGQVIKVKVKKIQTQTSLQQLPTPPPLLPCIKHPKTNWIMLQTFKFASKRTCQIKSIWFLSNFDPKNAKTCLPNVTKYLFIFLDLGVRHWPENGCFYTWKQMKYHPHFIFVVGKVQHLVLKQLKAEMHLIWIFE